MSTQTQSFASLDHFVFDLRSQLRGQAKDGLEDLERQLSEIGYGWLDNYVGEAVASSSKAPVTELMKTPSKTGTVKKTRATTAAAKDRTEKIKGINARLGIASPNPVRASPQNRPPLSPLQPRLINTLTSNLLAGSPLRAGKGSPLSKGKQPVNLGKEDIPLKGKAKAKKGKGKKSPEQDERMEPTRTASPITKKSSKGKISPIAVDEPPETIESTTVAVTKVKPSSASSSSRPQQVEGDAKHAAPAQVSEDMNMDVAPGPFAPEELEDGRIQLSEEINSNMLDQNENDPAIEPLGFNLPDHQPLIGIPSTLGVTDPSYPPTVEVPAQIATTAVPVRQVRSSWLSKALGTGTVPISGLPTAATDSTALRISLAASAQRQSTAVDFAGLRKSLMPVGGIKRKSDIGIEEEEDDEEKRPEKVVKLEPVVTVPLVTPTVESHFEFEVPLASSAGPGASASSCPTANPDSTPGTSATEQQTHADRHRSDIHKVTKALDEFRERNLAKEAAKAKAALAASAGPKQVQIWEPKAQSTGSGFLRGLGTSLGRSLGFGASAKANEEDEARRERELEDAREAELQAQEELKRIMGEGERPQYPEPIIEVESHPASLQSDAAVRETTPTPPAALSSLGAAIMTATEMEDTPEADSKDEDQVMEELDELLPSDSPVRPLRPPKPQRETTPPRQVVGPIMSTTPVDTPPREVAMIGEAPALHARVEKHQHQSPARMPKLGAVVELAASKSIEDAVLVRSIEQSAQPPYSAPAPSEELEMAGTQLAQDEEDELVEEDELDEYVPSPPRLVKSSSAASLAQSTSSQITNFGLASTIAAKTLGVKASAGQVKSIQLAAAAAKKEQAANDRKALQRGEAEQRKQQLAERKAEDERLKQEEDRKNRAAELEERKRARAELEKKRKDREERIAQIAKEKATKEAEIAAAAKAKADEEANKKRKLVQQSLNKSATSNNAKRPAGPGTAPIIKPKDPLRAIKLNGPVPPSMPSKMGPTAFRTATTTTEVHQTQSATITLVSSTAQADRRPLGPPSRPSHATAGAIRPSVILPHQQPAQSVLQQSRVALQTQLDEKALEVQSEDIVLPDIASEYSDSGDESDKSPDFKRPAWAESPELRAALQAQSTRNPDELFGPIRPLNMEELFKVRTGKFRARTSSANWNGGDRLTKFEEVEYARRMGFKAVGGGREGSGVGQGGGGNQIL